MRRAGPSDDRRREGGFTLIEALVALVIAAAVWALIAQSPLLAWRGLSATTMREQATALAHAEITRAGIDWPLSAGRREGTAPGGMRFLVTAVPKAVGALDEGAAPPGVYWISVEVSWQEPRSLARSTLQLATYKSAAAAEAAP